MSTTVMKINTDFLRKNQGALVLLVHPDIMILDQAQKECLENFHWPAISIGKTLSEDFLSGKLSDMASVQSWLTERVREIPIGTILLLEVDILFEPSFHLDPLVIFKRSSRFNHLVVLWPGTYSNDKVLSYAVPEHIHYRTWRNPDADIFPL
jgi:hypothetical protein